MRSRRVYVVLRLLLPFALAGAFALSCDGGGGDGNGPGEDTNLPDVPPTDAAEDVSPSPAYPAGPYGVLMGEVIEDLGFYDPETEEMVQLNQWYQHPKVKLLMLVSTAAW